MNFAGMQAIQSSVSQSHKRGRTQFLNFIMLPQREHRRRQPAVLLASSSSPLQNSLSERSQEKGSRLYAFEINRDLRGFIGSVIIFIMWSVRNDDTGDLEQLRKNIIGRCRPQSRHNQRCALKTLGDTVPNYRCIRMIKRSL